MQNGSRRQGRELAIKLLFSLFEGESTLDQLLETFWSSFRFCNDILGEPLDEVELPIKQDIRVFTEELVRGVAAHREQLDQIIDEFSTNWSLDRMSKVDLAILRMAAFELLFQPQTPTSVVINEAVEVGKRYGTRETPAFVNGLLDKVSRIYRPKSP
ncbi:MAG: transcription antitermination factor NusB [Desulfuromonadales bacterium C00003094]|jgi:N utilization substance protein B|nr:MAG: transcription antitermination factor NusB [Desulfuromonadales bacterium C00003094]OEU76023.1 MAG: transcription antitermination factor NusB [Desulfuromonadales bacterium C00003107]